MSYEISLATDADSAALFEVDTHPSADRRQAIQSAISAGHCYVARHAGQLCGYAVLDYSFYGNGFISLVVVHSSFRRRGVGSALVRHLESCCSTQKLFTSTNASNAPMQALLHGLGFAESGTIQNLDPGDPEIVFFKVPQGAG